MIDALLPTLADDALEILARDLRRLLSRIEDKQRTKLCQRSGASKFARWRAAITAEARRVARLPDDQALSALARLTDVESTARSYLKAARQSLEREGRAARNRQIATLARKGYTNADIARRTGVGKSTVARVVAASLKGDPT